MKTPYRDGTTHVIFEPLDFIARLAALVPKPRVNLTRYHGVFAPNSPYRVTITPAKRGRGSKAATTTPAEPDDSSFMERRTSMTWTQRLKRVFTIDIETCRHCQGPVKIIACIEDPVVIEKILGHLRNKASGGKHSGRIDGYQGVRPGKYALNRVDNSGGNKGWIKQIGCLYFLYTG